MDGNDLRDLCNLAKKDFEKCIIIILSKFIKLDILVNKNRNILNVQAF